jgi:molybdenum cofactor cytidylyltransferase
LLTNAGAPVIECHDADVGMSRSLIAGLRAGPDCEGWVIALGDMPFITPATIRSVARALEQGALIAQPVHENQRGHPVGLSSRLREELMQISGDEGARDVIRRHSEHCRLIQCDDPGTLRDIDTRNDLP